jgi:hypothetical protein
MALLSPGVQVSIIDQSNYIQGATNSVPFILLATAQNKISGAGVGVASGTIAANANKTYLMTSQRDLLNTFGVPFFYNTTAGTPINGYELNEYGLLAAYSALGITNQCYVQRVNVDLAALTASLTRPLGAPNNNTYWLDTANSSWGIFEWNLTTGAFTNQIPSVITSTADLQTGNTTPLASYGSIGDYAVTAGEVQTANVAGALQNPEYYKRGGPTSTQTSSTALSDLYNTWVPVGSDDWKTAWPTITGTQAPATLTANSTIIINNDTTVTVPVSPATPTGLSTAINTAGIDGVYSAVIGGALFIYADSQSTGFLGAVSGGAGNATTGIATIQFTNAGNAVPTPYPVGSANWQKQMDVINGTDNAYKLAKKYKVKVAFGIDCLFDSISAKNQGKILCKLEKWYTPFEILKMATHDNAELLSMSNKRNPYQEGKLGEISEGAYADMILVDGNPLENIKLIANPEKNFSLIMKNGVVYKNNLNK